MATLIPQQQALDRWDSLSNELREALWSEQNSTIVRQTCEREHIPPEKIPFVGRIAGYVLLGFLHPEDVSRELKEALGADQKTADAIAKDLNAKIFSPLRGELERAYAPGPHSASFAGTRPFDLDEIGAIKTQTFKAPSSSAWSPPLVSPPATRPEKKPSESLPVMLHEEPETRPITPAAGSHLDIKSSGFGEWEPREADKGIAKVDLGIVPPPARPAPKTEPPRPRVVHYTESKSPTFEFSQKSAPIISASPASEKTTGGELFSAPHPEEKLLPPRQSPPPPEIPRSPGSTPSPTPPPAPSTESDFVVDLRSLKRLDEKGNGPRQPQPPAG